MALVCGAGVEAVVEGTVYEMVASVGDSAAELLMVLLNLEDEVAGKGDVVVVVVVVVVVEAVASKVFSSVIWGLLKKKRTSLNIFLLICTLMRLRTEITTVVISQHIEGLSVGSTRATCQSPVNTGFALCLLRLNC